ncbi:hypothetical protein [Paenibacillus kobensis]|uniref:hypothetical protein n=1 Tax=Paenibacillus kobensis TaxID=59841 RepID=UPI000FD78EEF|nr:hypothetical protein [Paenibacillus kobensis]
MKDMDISLLRDDSLAKSLFANGQITDWRYPDKHGLCNRNLDCKELAVKEVLSWKGEPEPTRVFLHPWDCEHRGFLLRRTEYPLEHGWRVNSHAISDRQPLIQFITQAVQDEGYCLLYYKAFNKPFCSYYQRHDIIHWSLVIHCEEDGIWLFDDKGNHPYFSGSLGFVQWDHLVSEWGVGEGVALLDYDPDRRESSMSQLRRLSEFSVIGMAEQGGLHQLRTFINELSRKAPEELIPELERMEFDVHYFRRLREVWKSYALQNNLFSDEGKNLLHSVCRMWSLVIGVIMKWRRQPHREYQSVMIGHLYNAHEQEVRWIRYLSEWEGSE